MMVDPSGCWPSWVKKAAKVAAIVVVAAVVTAAVVASAGTAACAVGIIASSLGASATVAAAASTATIIGAYVVAGGIAAAGVSDAGEVVTGTNVIKEGIFGGDEDTYNDVKAGLYILAAGIITAGSMETGNCFVEGTLIKTVDGDKPIEDIEVGDLVYAESPETGEKGLKQVVRLFRNQTTELVHIKVKGEQITTTNEHPFYVPEKGWTAAVELRAGDKLVLLSGEIVVIEFVKHEILENPVTVYNFEVEDFHTYYVSELGVLVHNTCTPGKSKRYSPEKIAKKYNISENDFHTQVKPNILNQVKPKEYLVGRNPDIALNKSGDIAYQGANGRGFQDTGLNIYDIISQIYK
ncbi:Hint domain-containing protein [Mycoplasmatota bacterium]|nr:Hint domain-containing protein [Mycoplasmatota bacterium]